MPSPHRQKLLHRKYFRYLHQINTIAHSITHSHTNTHTHTHTHTHSHSPLGIMKSLYFSCLIILSQLYPFLVNTSSSNSQILLWFLVKRKSITSRPFICTKHVARYMWISWPDLLSLLDRSCDEFPNVCGLHYWLPMTNTEECWFKVPYTLTYIRVISACSVDLSRDFLPN